MAPKKLRHAGAAAADAHTAQQLLLEAQHTGLGVDQLLQLALADVPPCAAAKAAGSCKGSKHTSCFCGLVPLEGHYKQKGLWRKDEGSLGQDPSKIEREVGDPEACSMQDGKH